MLGPPGAFLKAVYIPRFIVSSVRDTIISSSEATATSSVFNTRCNNTTNNKRKQKSEDEGTTKAG